MNEQAIQILVSKEELTKFGLDLQACMKHCHGAVGNAGNPPEIAITTGQKYARVTRDGSAYCFIRLSDGAIMKPDGWTRPAKTPRGNIRNIWWGSALNYYGATYLR